MAEQSHSTSRQLDSSWAEMEVQGHSDRGYQTLQTLEAHPLPEDELDTPKLPTANAGFSRKNKLAFLLMGAIVVLLAFSRTKKQTEIDELCRPYELEYRREAQMAQMAGNKTEPSADAAWPGQVIDVPYTENEYHSLPINLRQRNKDGKTIEEVLYKEEQTRMKRIEFIKERAIFVEQNKPDQSETSNHPNIMFGKYNLISSDEQLEQAMELNRRDWVRLEAKFGLSAVREELPMCLIVPSYNNNARFRIESSLNSIFTQNYSNYRVVVIDDGSSDGSDQLYRAYFSFFAIDKQRYTYLENANRTTPLPNLYFGSINHCSRDAVVLTIDGDDQLIGRNILQVFNWAYQTKKAGVVYSNFFYFQQPRSVGKGFTSQYTEEQKKGNLYRDVPNRFSQLRSYRNELIFKIDPQDLKDPKGDFYIFTADHALYYPLLQLSCGRVHNIEHEFHYLYNIETESNTRSNEYRCKEYIIEQVLVKKKKYECSWEFDQRMNKL